MIIRINGIMLPIDEALNADRTISQLDAAINQGMHNTPIGGALYDYATGFVGDALETPVFIAKYLGKAIVNDLNGLNGLGESLIVNIASMGWLQ